MSAAPPEVAAGTTKAVVARKSFFITNPLCSVQQAVALTFPRQRIEPPLRRHRIAPARFLFFLAGPLELSCDPFATVVGKSDSRRHRGRSSRCFFTRPRRYVPDSALPFYLRSSSAKVLPKRAGDGETLMPAASMAAILLSASPLPPEMMAPAWPMRRPGGAVRPAMNPTIGFLRPRLASSVRN